MVPIKCPAELDAMRRASAVLKAIIDEIRAGINIGMTTQDLDARALAIMREKAVIPAFKGYRGFPANICVSVNEEVVHGIPSGRVLKEGDLLKVDIGIELDGFFSDSAFTVGLGRVDGRSKRLIDATKRALDLGIAQAKAGNHLSDVSWAIQSYVEAQGFSVVREFVGHGIGRQMHEPPEIMNYGLPHKGVILKEGMCLAIEPMVNAGTWEVDVSENGWTAITKDRLNSAHFEHTVAITGNGPEVLTR